MTHTSVESNASATAVPSVVVGDEGWLEKLDAATAGGSTALGDVHLPALEEHMASERAPLAPMRLHDRHRPSRERELEPRPDEVDQRFDRLEALLLDLAHRVDRFAGQVGPPPPSVEELQTIEVGIRAAARVMLRSSDELTAAVVSITDASTPATAALDRLVGTIERLSQRVHAVERRLDQIAESETAAAEQLTDALRRLAP